MSPTQIKMSTGAVYVGFLDWELDPTYVYLEAGCSLSFNKVSGRYDVIDIMDPTEPVMVNPDNIAISQTVLDESVTALVYSNYLGNWLAMMEERRIPVPEFVTDYVDRMESKFLEKSGGVSIRLKGRHAYYLSIDDARAELIRKEIEAVQRAYVNPMASTPCEDKVVKVDFGSKKP